MAGSGPGAARAVGQAMRTNPLPVIVPCHRIVAADGHLHGYSGSVDVAGSELAIKRSLLNLERSGKQ
jgi:methylated-DNA-[protein]-cysteine S-methyltransferase